MNICYVLKGVAFEKWMQKVKENENLSMQAMVQES